MPDQKALLMQQLIALLTQFIALNEAETAVEPQQSDAVEMLTIKECTVLIPGLSEHTLRKLIAQRKIYSIRTGEGKRGKILISKASLVEYLSGRAS